jgi:large subunit ribosomal protein L40
MNSSTRKLARVALPRIVSTSTTTSTRRSYAVASGHSKSNPKERDSTSADSRMDTIRKSLYPPQTTTFVVGGSSSSSSASPSNKKKTEDSPSNAVSDDGEPRPRTFFTALHESSKTHASSPTGAYHPQMIDRLTHILAPSSSSDPTRAKETHETITRAHLLSKRLDREARERSLRAKENSMSRACQALKDLSESSTDSSVKNLYEFAMYRPDARNRNSASPSPAPVEGKKLSLAERKYYEARIEGLFPREMKVPTETWPNGDRWDYGWKPVGV